MAAFNCVANFPRPRSPCSIFRPIFFPTLICCLYAHGVVDATIFRREEMRKPSIFQPRLLNVWTSGLMIKLIMMMTSRVTLMMLGVIPVHFLYWLKLVPMLFPACKAILFSISTAFGLSPFIPLLLLLKPGPPQICTTNTDTITTSDIPNPFCTMLFLLCIFQDAFALK